MNLARMPRVGVFDSGIGGLTVLGECLAVLPRVQFLYYGDNSNAPYGNRGTEEICSLVRRALSVFENIGVDLAVLACNTATTLCIDRMREEFSFPIVGTEPAVRLAARFCKRGLILATPRTAESERLKKLIRDVPNCSFRVAACEGLAGEIEQNVTRQGGVGNLDHFLPSFAESFDGVVLGCTHYVFFRDEIARFYGCKAYDGNRGVALRVSQLLNGGISVPFKPQNFPQNQNICFEKKVKEIFKNQVIFLGNSANINYSVFLRTFVSNQIKKK